MGFDSEKVVAGSGEDFVLQDATLNGSPSAWPSDAVVEFYLAPPLIPSSLNPSQFGTAKGYTATGVSITSTGLQANYLAVPVGNGYNGDLDVNKLGNWAKWWRVYSPSTGLDTVVGWCSFPVVQSPRTSANVPALP